MHENELVVILTGALGSLGFAVLFNIRGKRMVAGTLGGLLSCLLYVLLMRTGLSEAATYFFVSLSITFYAELMARALKSPTTTFLMISLIPLVPGGSLYYTMASVFEGNLGSFVGKAVNTLSLAAALALGIVLMSAFFKIFVQGHLHFAAKRAK